MTTALLPVEFSPPLIAPASPFGLAAVTIWPDGDTAPSDAERWLPSGVQFRQRTHRPRAAFGIWGASWCADPDDLGPGDLKRGAAVVDDDPDPYLAVTAWASDRLQRCGNLSEFDRAEVRERAEQTFAIKEPIAVETAFATRLVADAGTPMSATDPVKAVAAVEQTLALAGTVDALVHARLGWLAIAENLRLIVRDDADRTADGSPVLRTPSGHRWVFGGGYATPLGNRLIATPQTYGWRGQVQTREAIDYPREQFVAITERSTVIGYETVLAAAVIT